MVLSSPLQAPLGRGGIGGIPLVQLWPRLCHGEQGRGDLAATQKDNGVGWGSFLQPGGARCMEGGEKREGVEVWRRLLSCSASSHLHKGQHVGEDKNNNADLLLLLPCCKVKIIPRALLSLD